MQLRTEKEIVQMAMNNKREFEEAMAETPSEAT